ncbi:diguanylate cyclase [Roseibium sp. CAU 1637]|uniref:Diguanylate cyclase n=1 Tax=Roseibium limicola TaxID=2816037 RepID=A0A939ERJ1_9HYPH|nr:diguanylate cyclase [Roseibium limicola]MBO0347010.1 diguanylate cyclase [Roseibium limicola]
MTDNNSTVDIERTFKDCPEAVAVLTPEGIIRYANTSLLELLGWADSEIVGHPGEEILAHEDGAKMPSGFRRKDRFIAAADISMIPLADPNGTTLGTLLIGRDCSGRLELEDRVADTSELLREAIETISEGFALYDKQDRLVLCNANYRRLYSLSEDAMEKGVSFHDILQHGLKRDQYQLNAQSADDWLQERLERHHRADGEVHEQQLAGGRWLQVSEKRTPRGYIAGIRTDITNLKHTQAELQDAYANMSLLTDSLSHAIVEVDMDGMCSFINDYGAAWYNLKPDQIIGKKYRDFLSPEHISKISVHFRQALGGRRLQIETMDAFPDGLVRDLQMEFIPKLSSAGFMAGLIIVSTDITEAKKTERSLASLYQVTATQELSSDQKIQQILRIGCEHFDLPYGIVSNIIEDGYTVVWAESPAGEIPVGAHFELGDTYCSNVIGDDKPLGIMHTAKSEFSLHPCYKNFPLETYIGVPFMVNGERYGTINFTSPEPRLRPFTMTDYQLICQFADWVGHEIAREQANTALIDAKIRLERLASIDDLTGLLNRRVFLEQANKEVARYRRDRRIFTTLLLDIDHFKLVNDNYGHGVGDEVLREFSKLVQEELRVVDIFGRVGGEEFAILLINTDAEGAKIVCDRILERLRNAPLLPSHDLKVTCSIGVAVASADDVEFSSLLHRADVALYEAKEKGRDQMVLAPPSVPSGKQNAQVSAR